MGRKRQMDLLTLRVKSARFEMLNAVAMNEILVIGSVQFQITMVMIYVESSESLR